jgi:hypothetical protein
MIGAGCLIARRTILPTFRSGREPDMPAVPAVAIAGLALSAASAAVGAVGAMNSAKAQQENANYQAEVAKNNQTIAAQNAEYSIQAGNAKAEDESLAGRARQGAVVAALAANGLDVNSGTPSAIEKTEKETDALSASRVVDASQLQAYGYRTQGSNFGAQAGLDTAEAGQAGTAGELGLTGGLLAGASSVASNYTSLAQKGAFESGGAPDPLPAAFNPEYGGAFAAGGLT